MQIRTMPYTRKTYHFWQIIWKFDKKDVFLHRFKDDDDDRSHIKFCSQEA